MPFGIQQYIQYILHGLTSVLLCVPFIFADSESVDLAIACDGFSFVMEIVCIFHSGCRGDFQTVFNLYCCVMGRIQPTTKHNGYFTFQMTIDITGVHNTISFVLQRCFSNSSRSKMLCNELNIADNKA